MTLFTISGQEGQRISLDITGILSAWVKGMSNYGLVVKFLIEKGRNFILREDPALPPGVRVKVEVYYTAKEVNK